MAAPTLAELALPLLPVVGAGMRVPLVGGGEAQGVDLDLAATAPALQSVADHLAAVLPHLGSVHRGAGWRSELATGAYEAARATVGRVVGARDRDLVVFTRNTTDALNLLASAVPGPVIVLDVEHHADLLPWRAAPGLRVVPAAATLEETIAALDAELAAAPAALLAVTGASNVTGEVLPLRRLATLAHRRGARLAVDGAQLVPHRPVDLAAEGVDYLALSGHKAYAPYGAGALVGRADWLDAASPHLAGGGAVDRVRIVDGRPEPSWRTGAARHEGGTPNVLGAVALARALEELASLDPERRLAHEAGLRDRLAEGLAAVPGVTVLRLFPDVPDAVGVVTFTVAGLEARLVALALAAEWGIAVRDGGFCAHPLLDRLTGGAPALRASVGVGSSAADVDALLTAVADLAAHGPRGVYQHSRDGWRIVGDERLRPAWAVPAEGGGCGYGG
jgi:selenocysteine lyase/cysteine desulfurase